MRSVLSAALAAVIVTFTVIGAPPQVAQATTLDTVEAELVARINDFRASRGLPTLTVSSTLTAAAKWMSTDMSRKNYFSHTSSDGRSPQRRMADAGYPAYQTWTGENLAAGYSTARTVLDAWLRSSAHYAVLVNANYRAIGVGRAYSTSSTYGWYWTADFGGIVDRAVASTTDTGYHSAWVGQSAYPTLRPGEVTTLSVGLRNTGSKGWYVGRAGQQANLGTSQPLDVMRPDLAYRWMSGNRLTTTTASHVAPGEVGWFQFQVRAPSTPGTYRLSVRGVIDGVTWMEDQGIYFIITVR